MADKVITAESFVAWLRCTLLDTASRRLQLERLFRTEGALLTDAEVQEAVNFYNGEVRGMLQELYLCQLGGIEGPIYGVDYWSDFPEALYASSHAVGTFEETVEASAMANFPDDDPFAEPTAAAIDRLYLDYLQFPDLGGKSEGFLADFDGHIYGDWEEWKQAVLYVDAPAPKALYLDATGAWSVPFASGLAYLRADGQWAAPDAGRLFLDATGAWTAPA